MSTDRYFDQLSIDKSVAERLNFNPYYPRFLSGLGDPIIVNGEKFIDLASNNYLGIAGSDKVKKAMIEGVTRYGASMCGTPIATGSVDAFSRVEARLAKFVGLEASTLFPSCYQANVGIFSAIAKREDVILFDHYAHASLIHGIRSAGCRVLPFLHNDVPHLEKLLHDVSGHGQAFVVTESVFSTEGSVAPFEEIVGVCQDHDAVPVVDDSHGIGVLGRNGRGILEEKGIEGYQGIYTASLGKALANFGGMVAGRGSFIEYLRYACPGLIYSTALPPSILLGIEKALDIVETDFPVLGARMWRYRNMISSRLRELGFHVVESQAPITSVACGGLDDTIGFAKELYARKILSTPFVPPSVPRDGGRVRLIAGAGLQESSVQRALEAFAEMAAVSS
jgi:7-keto-8-aminopelargonate synthetase-like enzyme